MPYLRISVHGVDSIGVPVRLVSSARCWVHISHDAITCWYDRLRHCLLHLLFLFPVFGASVLEPNLQQKQKSCTFVVQTDPIAAGNNLNVFNSSGKSCFDMSFCNAYKITGILNFNPKIDLEYSFKDTIDIYWNSRCHNTENHNINSNRKTWKGENTWRIRCRCRDYFEVDPWKMLRIKTWYIWVRKISEMSQCEHDIQIRSSNNTKKSLLVSQLLASWAWLYSMEWAN